MALVFDIETDGLHPTKVHCIVVYDTEAKLFKTFSRSTIKDGVGLLCTPNATLVGHNIINYDIPALEKVLGVTIPKDNIVDTLVVAKILYSNIRERESERSLPARLVGSHSLDAYGYRLGVLKGDYGKAGEQVWREFNQEMLEYCKQDVRVTYALYKTLQRNKDWNEEAIKLETDAQLLMTRMELSGYPFDIDKAEQLKAIIDGRAKQLTEAICERVPPIPDADFIPKVNNAKRGYVKGVPVKRFKEFNPNSRDQLRYIILEHFKYTPADRTLFDAKGMLKVDEPTFQYLTSAKDVPDELRELAKLYEEYLMAAKRQGQLSDGRQAWLKCYNKNTGCIHGRINPNGAVTGRATHSQPNISQVPAVGVPYGAECRSLFTVPEGWSQVGIDTSGLELRCLSHFLYPFDKGAYAHEVLNGDIHTANQKAAGLETRSEAKTFIYAFLYGAGDARIGEIVGGDSNDGKRLKNKFLKNTPAIKKLRKVINDTLVHPKRDFNEPTRWKRRFLFALDGRKLYVRSPHSALNLLLQSAGALICKSWIVGLDKALRERGYRYGWDGDYTFLTWVHDEVQIASKTISPDEINAISSKVLDDVQKMYNFRVKLDTEMKCGKNWAECH